MNTPHDKKIIEQIDELLNDTKRPEHEVVQMLTDMAERHPMHFDAARKKYSISIFTDLDGRSAEITDAERDELEDNLNE